LLHCASEGEHSMMLVCISNAICSPSWQVQCICPVQVTRNKRSDWSGRYRNWLSPAPHTELVSLIHQIIYAFDRHVTRLAWHHRCTIASDCEV